MAERKAASVLPLPVGAQIRVCVARRDGRPALLLGSGRLRERRREPGPHGGRERLEHLVIGDEVRVPKGCRSDRCLTRRKPPGTLFDRSHPADDTPMSTTTTHAAAASRPISAVPYLPGLDGMRALAVVAVMVYHANPAWLPGGFLGVEVFFVISGYLITLLLIGEHERTGTVSLRQFYLRRARRLLPALFALLIGVTVFTALFRRDALGQLRGDVLAALGYVSNWYQIWVGQGYTAAGDFAPLRHLWSLAVEEQFYLLWPLAMIGLIRLGRRRLPVMSMWLVAAAIGITAVVAAVSPTGPIGTCEVTPEAYWQVGGRCISKMDFLYLSTPTRLTGLLLGAALAMVWRPTAVMRGPLRDRGRVLDVGALVGLVGLGGDVLVVAHRDGGWGGPVVVPRRVPGHWCGDVAGDRRGDASPVVDRAVVGHRRCCCGSGRGRTGCTCSTGRSTRRCGGSPGGRCRWSSSSRRWSSPSP